MELEWVWNIARYGENGERDLWIGRETRTGRPIELLLPAGLFPGNVINASGDAAAERARIRRELLALWEASPAGPPHLYMGDIDRICPEGE